MTHGEISIIVTALCFLAALVIHIAIQFRAILAVINVSISSSEDIPSTLRYLKNDLPEPAPLSLINIHDKNNLQHGIARSIN